MYKNMMYLSKLTKKQLKLCKQMVPSTEQGRPILKHRLLKTIHSNKITTQNQLHAKKVVRRSTKRLWFFDTAAPIPGVRSLKKRKTLFSNKQRAFKTIQSWLAVFNKKQIKSFLGALLTMESQLASSFRKSAFVYNPQQSKAIVTLVNGNFVQKQNFVNTIADFSNIAVVSTKVQSFYATKKLF